MIKRNTTTVLALLFVINAPLYAQSTSQKTLVKSFNLQGMDMILLDLDGEVEVKSWDSKIMRVQMEISSEDISATMLKSLVQVGRYNLKAIFGEDHVKIVAPSMRKEIRISGKLLEEQIVYTVFAPEEVMVKLADESSTQSTSAQHTSF